MNIDTKDVKEVTNLPDGFVMFENDQGFFIALQTKTAGIVAAQKIDKAAYDCIKRREGIK